MSQTPTPRRKEVGRHYTRFWKPTLAIPRTYSGARLETGLIFSEAAPKTLAALHPERLAFPAAMIYYPLLKITYPIVWLIALPFRLVGACFEGLFQFIRAVLLLPAKLLGGGGDHRKAALPA